MFPVVDRDGVVRGVVSRSRLERRIAGDQGALPVAEFAQVREYLDPHTTLLSAVVRMDQIGARQMLVVDEDKRAVGMLAMSDVMRAYAAVAGRETNPRWSEVRLPSVPAPDETGSYPPACA